MKHKAGWSAGKRKAQRASTDCTLGNLAKKCWGEPLQLDAKPNVPHEFPDTMPVRNEPNT
eukprot:2794941-Amphidinium_carterae.1